MKKILGILLSGIMIFTLVGCGSKKQVDDSKLKNNEEVSEAKKDDKSEYLTKVYELLESDKPYSEFDQENKEYVSKFLETEWDSHSDEIKEKFLDRKNEYHEYWQNKKNEILAGSNGDKVTLSETDKTKIKRDVEDRLKDKTVNGIDVLTNSETGKPMLSIQLVGDILKENVNSEEAKLLCNNIYNKLIDITQDITIELVDKNYQLISVYTNGNYENR